MNACSNDKGVTLVELMAVLMIVAVLTALSYVGMNIVRKERVNSTARQLLSDVQKIRIDAMTSLPTVTTVIGYGVRFTPPDSYTVFSFNDKNIDFGYAGAAEEGQPLPGDATKVPNTTTIPSNLVLSLQNNDGNTVLIYNRYGYPKTYQADGSNESPVLSPVTNDFLTVVIQDSSSAALSKCIQITDNSIREGVLSGTTCNPL